MSPGDNNAFEEFYRQSCEEFQEFTRYLLPHSDEEFQANTQLAMKTAEDKAYGQVPAWVQDLINEHSLLPQTDHFHEKFGRGVSIQENAAYRHHGDHMLPQLVYDSMLHWEFGDMGAYQFWISPKDLKDRNWDGVKLSFECD